jgi:hypothetical protein
MSEWYYAQGNAQRGPVPVSFLIDSLRTGGLTAGDLVWREGMAQWVPAGQVPELAGAVGGATPTQPAQPMGYASPVSPAIAPNYSQPYYPPPPAQHLGFSITAMVLGIVSYCCCSLGILPAVTGLVFGLIALNGMKRTGDPRGKGMAIAGVVLASVYVVLFAIFIVYYALLAPGHPHGSAHSSFQTFPPSPHPWPTNP